MMLGKRTRPPIKRNTSMTEFTLDFSDPHNPWGQPADVTPAAQPIYSPRNLRRSSADFGSETSHFLRYCSLCKRPLIPGHDIYMYRGDSAFCTLECRQQQIIQDERKERRAAAAAAAIAEICSRGDKPTVTAVTLL